VAGLLVARAIGFDGATVGEIPGTLPRLDLALPLGRLPELVVPAIVIALVGFAEPAAIARTYAQRSRTRRDAGREFVSQGMANGEFASGGRAKAARGLFGGCRAGGGFSRSAVAREAGARTGWSGAVTGVLVLVSLPFVGVFASLPSAVLAAVIFSSVLGLIRV